ncbi:hypothetical protein QX233_00230 [Chryseobacterium gambrini]|uniref:Uncharacterized protein n=1 Tax=Chryseobacterium gambrini TaxID=373672 RepID=A0AAJ1R0J2_9FLAO|nr:MULTISPECIES: hypothetical protein [Chryseobacterium]MDN4010877.1 hypothetical protein [Chryseobacterium gambrini]QWA38992.1 hypothetical protein KKI44_01925 [Chryseobacterium sp. ZHDP1]
MLGILLISQFCYSQNIIQTDIQGKKLNDFIQFENKLGSKVVKTDEEYISFEPVLQPVIFERKEKEIPNLRVFYKAYKTDSVIAEILYEWDVYNFDKGENVKKPVSFNKAMIKKYEELMKEISEKYGKSTQKGDLKKLELINSDDGLERSDEWNVNSALNINSDIILSEYYEKNGMVTTSPTRKIRVYVKNERKEDDGNALAKEKISLYTIEFLKFIEKLKTSDFAGAKDLLSEKIASSTTDDMLKKLAENIHLDKQIDVFMTGFQLVNDGSQYPMVQFKYKEEVSSPKEMITVLFEDSGKIIGIKPMKRLE